MCRLVLASVEEHFNILTNAGELETDGQKLTSTAVSVVECSNVTSHVGGATNLSFDRGK